VRYEKMAPILVHSFINSYTINISYEESMKRKKHIGSSFESFLEDEGIFEEVNVAAIKSIIARSLKEYMKKEKKINIGLVSNKSKNKVA